MVCRLFWEVFAWVRQLVEDLLRYSGRIETETDALKLRLSLSLNPSISSSDYATDLTVTLLDKQFARPTDRSAGQLN